MNKSDKMGTKKILPLLVEFSIPAIIGMLVNAIYNIVDRMFIGNAPELGSVGLAGISICYPVTLVLMAISLMIGMGGATRFSIALGQGKKEDAGMYMGNGLTLTIILGLIFMILGNLFLDPMLKVLGASKTVLPYAESYLSIILYGAVFQCVAMAGNNFSRAQGNPKNAMISQLIGAGFNILFDYILICIFHMGMEGAALATITGQIISFSISLRYMFHFKTIKLSRESFIVSAAHCKKIFILGASACFNQIAMTVVQIVMNNTLSHYGAQSIYGGDIPLACAGIITKVNMIFMSFVIGISQGTQPVIGFNYGAKKYARVRKTYLLALGAASALSLIAFACFQIFPRQIISIFGNGSDLYFKFSERYFRIYMFLTIVNGIQPVTSNFFNSIGKSQLGVFMSLTRQIIFLLPLIIAV